MRRLRCRGFRWTGGVGMATVRLPARDARRQALLFRLHQPFRRPKTGIAARISATTGIPRRPGLTSWPGSRSTSRPAGPPWKRKGRKGAKLELRAGFVDLVPPGDLPKGSAPLRMLAVRVVEKRPPAGRGPSTHRC